MNVNNRFIHTRERLNERFNIDISPKEYFELCEVLKNAYVIGEKSKNRDIRILNYKNRNIAFGYNKQKNLINTVMYPMGKYTRMVKRIIKNGEADKVFANEGKIVKWNGHK